NGSHSFRPTLDSAQPTMTLPFLSCMMHEPESDGDAYKADRSALRNCSRNNCHIVNCERPAVRSPRKDNPNEFLGGEKSQRFIRTTTWLSRARRSPVHARLFPKRED